MVTQKLTRPGPSGELLCASHRNDVVQQLRREVAADRAERVAERERRERVLGEYFAEVVGTMEGVRDQLARADTALEREAEARTLEYGDDSGSNWSSGELAAEEEEED